MTRLVPTLVARKRDKTTYVSRKWTVPAVPLSAIIAEKLKGLDCMWEKVEGLEIVVRREEVEVAERSKGARSAW
jgi:hypothetical protein